jgi:hypothetical protein
MEAKKEKNNLRLAQFESISGNRSEFGQDTRWLNLDEELQTTICECMRKTSTLSFGSRCLVAGADPSVCGTATNEWSSIEEVRSVTIWYTSVPQRRTGRVSEGGLCNHHT